ncbi:MAG TPA: hypothetical protein VD902_22175 [Symbiobacteriaceae bacterium]|nr:hypothetical protein [Symbiobacteriaceae bacterium]
MKNLKALLKVQFRTVWRGTLDNIGGGKSKWGMLLLPLMLLAFVPLLGLMIGLFFSLYIGGAAIGQGQIVLTLAFTGGQLACLMFGVFYVISAFYFTKDLKLLIPLPLRPGEIVLAKFIGILIGEYLTLAPIVLPALVIYGIFADVAWTYVPFALAIYLMLPVIPLVVASLFSIVLMKVTNLRRNRDLWRVVGALFGVGMALIFNRVGRMAEYMGSGGQRMSQLLEQQQALVEKVGRYFPTSLWATDALMEGAPAAGVLSFLLFTAVAVAALAVMVWLAEKLFYGGALGGDETRTSGRKLTRDELVKETGRTQSPLRALLFREIRLLNRTPSFLMAALMPVVLMPVFIMLPLMQETEFAQVLPRLQQWQSSPLIPAIAIGAVLFMNSMSNVAATAVSREGRYFWISRSLPVAPRVQVQAKVIHSLIFSVFNIAVVLGGLAFLRILTPVTLVSVVIGGAFASSTGAYGGVAIDLLRPNLKWTDPQQAMKGNYNVLFAMLFIWLNAAVLAAVVALLYSFARPLLLPGIVLFFGLETWGLAKLSAVMADKRYLEIED